MDGWGSHTSKQRTMKKPLGCCVPCWACSVLRARRAGRAACWVCVGATAACLFEDGRCLALIDEPRHIVHEIEQLASRAGVVHPLVLLRVRCAVLLHQLLEGDFIVTVLASDHATQQRRRIAHLRPPRARGRARVVNPTTNMSYAKRRRAHTCRGKLRTRGVQEQHASHDAHLRVHQRRAVEQRDHRGCRAAIGGLLAELTALVLPLVHRDAIDELEVAVCLHHRLLAQWGGQS